MKKFVAVIVILFLILSVLGMGLINMLFQPRDPSEPAENLTEVEGVGTVDDPATETTGEAEESATDPA